MGISVVPEESDRCAGPVGCSSRGAEEAEGQRESLQDSTNTNTSPLAVRTARPRWRARAAAFCWRIRYRLVGLGMFLTTVIVLIACREMVGDLWDHYSAWLEANKIKGASSFVLVVAVLTIICFPAAIPTLAAGAVYGACNGIATGVAIGTAIIFVGATLGSLVSFLLGRYAFRGLLESINARSRWARALDLALKKNGLKVIVLMRLSPVVPYSVFNYLAACTSVSFRDFLLGSLAVLPGAAMFVFLGAQSAAAVSMIGSDEEGKEDQEGPSDTVMICILVVGVVLTLAAVSLMGFYAKRELRKLMPGLESTDSTNLRETASEAVLVPRCDSENPTTTKARSSFSTASSEAGGAELPATPMAGV